MSFVCKKKYTPRVMMNHECNHKWDLAHVWINVSTYLLCIGVLCVLLRMSNVSLPTLFVHAVKKDFFRHSFGSELQLGFTYWLPRISDLHTLRRRRSSTLDLPLTFSPLDKWNSIDSHVGPTPVAEFWWQLHRTSRGPGNTVWSFHTHQ